MKEYKDPRTAFGEALVDVGTKFEEVIALSADSSGGSKLGQFKDRFPDRHLEFGIMEQGVIGFAAGLATTGKIPFVVAIAPFVTARPFEMFRNDLGYMRQNVKVVGRCAGLTYSTLGATHHSLEDIAIIRTIPGVIILNPGDPVEIKKAVHAAAKHLGPTYLRIGNPKMPVLFNEDSEFEIGKGVVMRAGKEVTIIGTGTVLSQAHKATEILVEEGVDVRLINLHTIKPIDRETIILAAMETGRIVTVEEHYLHGGMGSAVAEVLASTYPVPMRMCGVDDQFADNGPYFELLGLYDLQAQQIVKTVKGLLATTSS